MSSPQQTRRFVEALHAQNLKQEKLFQLIAALANCLDRSFVVETMQDTLGVNPIEKGDCVLFNNIAVRFGEDDRVKSLYKVIDGSTTPAKVVIQGSLRDRKAT